MRKALKSRAEFLFVDAPYLAENASSEDADDSAGSTIGGRTWWQWTDLEPGTRPSRAASYKGWDASQNAIQQALEENWPVDGLLGFSQGATAAALFLAHSAGAPDGTAQPHWAVFIGGFMPRDVNYAGAITRAAPLGVRSLHVSGKKDALVPPERSAELWGCFEEDLRSVYEHPGAHMVPTCSGEFKQAMVEFLDEAKVSGMNSSEKVGSGKKKGEIQNTDEAISATTI